MNKLTHDEWIKKVEKIVGKVDELELKFELDDILLMDTYLTVRYKNSELFGKDKWAHYISFVNYRGSIMTYRKLFQKFANKKGFISAYGYILEENETHWLARKRYFKFDKLLAPSPDIKILDKPLKLIKPQYK